MADMTLGTVKGVAEAKTNNAMMWRYFTTSVYASGDLPVLATREALQNAVDACRARFAQGGKPLRGGRFEVTWDPATRSLTWEDNGIGMDAATIEHKFLDLGTSGKTSAADSGQAAGGFGVAKAVILGTSSTFRWELHSRDNLTTSHGPGGKEPIYHAPMLHGTRITIHDVLLEFDSRYDYASNRKLPLMERLRVVLAANDLDGMTLVLNGVEVSRMFSRKAGSRVAFDGSWGDGTTAVVKAYRRPPGDDQGAYYIRLGGLFQFGASSQRGELKADVVIDLTTRVRPGDKGYPLNAARDALQDQTRWAFQDLAAEVERESESTGTDNEYEIFDPDSDDAAERSGADEIAEETRQAFEDPVFQAAIADARGGLREYKAAQDFGTFEKPSSSAPAGSRSGRGERDDVPDGMLILDAEEMGVPGTPEAATAEIRLALMQADFAAAEAAGVDPKPGAGGIFTNAVARALAQDMSWDSNVQVVSDAIERAMDASVAVGGGGLMQAAALAQLDAPMKLLAPHGPKRVNPFGKLAGLRISKKNYDRQKARRFRKGFGKWLPELIAWDGTLRIIAAEARVRRRFKPGFVLDDTKMGMVASGTAGVAVIYIHPDRFAQAIKVHKARPLALAAYVHGLAVHELTHLDGRMGDGHSEDFTVAREDMGASTAHLLPAISILLSRVLRLEVKDAPEVKQIRSLERRLERATTALAVARRSAKGPPDCGGLNQTLQACQRDASACQTALREAQGNVERMVSAARQEAVRACEAVVTGQETSWTASEICQAAADPLTPMVASFVDRLLELQPGGLSRRYIEGFAVRHEARLRSAVTGLLAKSVMPSSGHVQLMESLPSTGDFDPRDWSAQRIVASTMRWEPHDHLYYELLSVRPDATESEIYRAWRTVQQGVDDQFKPMKLAERMRFMLRKQAYDVLSNKEWRRDYDANGNLDASFSDLRRRVTAATTMLVSGDAMTDDSREILLAVHDMGPEAYAAHSGSGLPDLVARLKKTLHEIDEDMSKDMLPSRIESLPRKVPQGQGHLEDAKVAHVVAAIRANLGPHVLRSDWRQRRPVNAAPSWGCCYVASEAAYHALGGAGSGLRVMHVTHEGAPHWYLTTEDGRVVDPTADQFSRPVPYGQGKGKGFLTAAPSKRALALMADAGLSAG